MRKLMKIEGNGISEEQVACEDEFQWIEGQISNKKMRIGF